MVSKRVLIKNTRVYNDKTRRFDVRDVMIERVGGASVITRVESNIIDREAEQIFAHGRILMPAFFDTWARISEPGFESRETYSTGSNAAVYGGFGNVLLQPFGSPVTDNIKTLNTRITDAEKNSACKMYFTAALTLGNAGKELCDYDALFAAGAVAFTDGKYECLSDDLLLKAMRILADKDYLMMATPVHQKCYKDKDVNLGRISRIMKLNGIPASAEVLSIARYVIFSRETGCRVHFSGVSTKAGVEIIRNAKADGVRITASAFPNNFCFKEDDIPFFGTLAKVWPPLRTAEDVDAVAAALSDKTLDCIASDHTPLHDYEKVYDFRKAYFGTLGLQTAFSAACTYLLYPRRVDLFRLRELFVDAPYKIMGLKPPVIAPGEKANCSLVTTDTDFIVTENYLKSKSRNSIFNGLTLRGVIDKTFIV